MFAGIFEHGPVLHVRQTEDFRPVFYPAIVLPRSPALPEHEQKQARLQRIVSLLFPESVLGHPGRQECCVHVSQGGLTKD